MKTIRALLVVVVLTPLAVVGYAIVKDGWTATVTFSLVLFGVAGAVLSLLVRRHARTHAYRCDVCREVFAIGAWTDFASPHYPNKKRLTCPRCGEVSWCEELDRGVLADGASDSNSPAS